MFQKWVDVFNTITDTKDKDGKSLSKLQKVIIRTAERAQLARQRSEQKAVQMQKFALWAVGINLILMLGMLTYGICAPILGWNMDVWQVFTSIIMGEVVLTTAITVAYNPLRQYHRRLETLNNRLSLKLLNPNAPTPLMDRLQNIGDQVVDAIEQFDSEDAHETWKDWKGRIKNAKRGGRRDY